MFIMRKIKNGIIKWDNRYWETKGDTSHLEGMRFAFCAYAPDFNLLYLWGNEKNYKCKDEKQYKELWSEDCELLGIQCNGDNLKQQKGTYCITDKKNDERIIYKSRNIEWWFPIEVEGIT